MLHSLLAAAVLAHTLIGCCAHGVAVECRCAPDVKRGLAVADRHDHFTADGVTADGVTAERVAEGGAGHCGKASSCCSAHLVQSNQQQTPIPAVPQECCRGRCHWVVAGSRLVEIESACSADCISSLSTFAAEYPSLSLVWPRAFVVQSPHPLGVRPHLAKHVLLL